EAGERRQRGLAPSEGRQRRRPLHPLLLAGGGPALPAAARRPPAPPRRQLRRRPLLLALPDRARRRPPEDLARFPRRRSAGGPPGAEGARAGDPEPDAAVGAPDLTRQRPPRRREVRPFPEEGCLL